MFASHNNDIHGQVIFDGFNIFKYVVITVTFCAIWSHITYNYCHYTIN